MLGYTQDSKDIEMAYRYGKRHKQLFLAPRIEDYVPAKAPVLVYDGFVKTLDFNELYIELDALSAHTVVFY